MIWPFLLRKIPEKEKKERTQYLKFMPQFPIIVVNVVEV